MCFAIRRREGYLDALASRGISSDPALLVSGEMNEPLGYDATRTFLSLPSPPTAIMTSSVIPALGVIRAVQEAGLSIGRDISLITHDDCLSFLQRGGDVPLLTSVRSSIREAGSKVAANVIRLIENPDCGPINELWEAELVLGQSTGPAA